MKYPEITQQSIMDLRLFMKCDTVYVSLDIVEAVAELVAADEIQGLSHLQKESYILAVTDIFLRYEKHEITNTLKESLMDLGKGILS